MQRRAFLRAGATTLGLGAGVVGSAAAHDPPLHTPPDDSPGGSTTATEASDGYEPLGSVDVAGATEAVVADGGRTAYVAATTGYAVVDLSDPTRPAVVADRRDRLADREGGPLAGIHDVKHDGKTLLAVGPANPRREESLSGALVVDFADPANPVERGFYETDFPVHNCDLDGETAYLTANVSDDTWLEVVDVAGETPEKLGEWSLTDVDEGWADVPRSLRVVHDVYVQDGVAYVAHWDAGTWLLDVSDPSAPMAISHVADRSLAELREVSPEEARTGRVALPGNSHYAAVDETGDLLAVGREAWAIREDGDGGPGGIDLYDVSDPTAPEPLAHVAPPPTDDATLRGLWTTSHNFELRGGTLYSSWYAGGVRRFDVSDPSNPRLRTWWADATVAQFWTARVGVPGETFVGSSMGPNRDRGRLYVFPDEEGRTVRGLHGHTPSATDSATGTVGRVTPTPSPTRPSSTRSNDPTRTATDGTGFGALAALAGLGAGALAWRRRG